MDRPQLVNISLSSRGYTYSTIMMGYGGCLQWLLANDHYAANIKINRPLLPIVEAIDRAATITDRQRARLVQIAPNDTGIQGLVIRHPLTGVQGTPLSEIGQTDLELWVTSPLYTFNLVLNSRSQATLKTLLSHSYRQDAPTGPLEIAIYHKVQPLSP